MLLSCYVSACRFLALDHHYIEITFSVCMVEESWALKVEAVCFSETLSIRGYVPEHKFYCLEVVSSTANRQFQGTHRGL